MLNIRLENDLMQKCFMPKLQSVLNNGITKINLFDIFNEEDSLINYLVINVCLQLSSPESVFILEKV